MPVAKPAMVVVGTNGRNIFSGVNSRKIAIVAHIMEGTLAGCDEWFADPHARASANYGVGRDGAIHQYVDPEGFDCPLANGNVANPDAAALALWYEMGRADPNYWTVSIEHEGFPGDIMPPAQLAASGQLAAWLCQRFAIPADENHLMGHYEFDSVTRPPCRGWDRAGGLAWEAAIAAAQHGAAPADEPEDE